MSKCYFCGGQTQIKKIDVDFRWGDKLFVIQNVPVEVCTKCGERYYSAKVSHRMDQIVQKRAPIPTRHVVARYVNIC